MLRTVLFDLDDTLVDQESAANVAVVGSAAEHGIHDVRCLSGGGRSLRCTTSAISDENYRSRSSGGRGRVNLALDVSDDEADAIFAGYLRRYEAGWTLFDDAVPALRRARSAGLAVAIFTNGNEDHSAQKLRLLGLEDEADTLIASSSLPAGKPDPRAFMGRLSVSASGLGGSDDWQQRRKGRSSPRCSGPQSDHIDRR